MLNLTLKHPLYIFFLNDDMNTIGFYFEPGGLLPPAGRCNTLEYK